MEGGERGADQKGSWEERGGDAIERVVVPGCSGRPCSMHLFLPPVCMCTHTRTHMPVRTHTHTHMPVLSFTFPKICEIDEETDSDKGFHEEGVKEEAWERIWSMSLILPKMTSDFIIEVAKEGVATLLSPNLSKIN